MDSSGGNQTGLNSSASSAAHESVYVLYCTCCGFTHIDSVIAKDSVKASSSIWKVESLTGGSEGGGLLGVELFVCGCEWHRLYI